MHTESTFNSAVFDKTKTIELLKKYWILFTGFLLLFAGILYIFRVGYDDGWISPVTILVMGIAGSMIGYASSIILFRKNARIIAEITAGFTCGFTFTVIAYAHFTDMLTHTIAYGCIIAAALCISVIAFRHNFRVFATLGLASALSAPLIVWAPAFHLFNLYLYILALNIVIIGFGLIKKWRELLAAGIIIDTLLYFGYASVLQFKSWNEPFLYIFIIFLLYAAGSMIMVKREDGSPERFPVLLFAVNLIVFFSWSLYIFSCFRINLSIPFIITGGILLVSFLLFLFLFGRASRIPLTSYLVGFLITAVSGVPFSVYLPGDISPFIQQAAVWLILASSLFIYGYKIRNGLMITGSFILWMIILVYTTITQFSRFISYFPFLNPPAVLWSAIILSGLLMSVYIEKFSPKKSDKGRSVSGKVMSYTLASLSHLIVFCFLSVQIIYAGTRLDMSLFELSCFVSSGWAVFTIILYFWGWKYGRRFFIITAYFVLVMTAIKMIFLDILGETTILKSVFMFITSTFFVFAGFLNYRRQTIISFIAQKEGEIR
ncbi:MAG: DUF2339 domain-containing protein [Spirochaetales bacterium]|nr:DUF2339 domain-containing protein [Spirochaetales bacterium]